MSGTIASRLASLAAELGELVDGAGLSLLGDPEVMDVVTEAGCVLRRTEAMIVTATGELQARSVSADRDARLTTRLGCRNISEVLQRATRVGPQTAGRWERCARAVRGGTAFATGEPLPPPFPAMRAALLDGAVGVDGLLAVVGPLADVGDRAPAAGLLAADEALAAAATGSDDAGPPACADLLRVQATAWALALDQDGEEPREAAALRRRGVTLGVERDGLVPFKGALLAEVAGQLQRIFDAVDAPAAGEGGVRFRPEGGEVSALEDERRAPQRRHDALAIALHVAAASATLPTIGGAAPTLVVSVREEDLAAERGSGFTDAGTPVPLGTARHIACHGVVQRVVLGEEGRILSLATTQRVFTGHQRRAIVLRDGGCVIPGCGVPAAWCEIHHADEHSRGGPTHTDNGVLLCWFHHRHLDHSGWTVRMRSGVPEVRAPRWIDPLRRWRRSTRSPVRHLRRIARRT